MSLQWQSVIVESEVARKLSARETLVPCTLDPALPFEAWSRGFSLEDDGDRGSNGDDDGGSNDDDYDDGDSDDDGDDDGGDDDDGDDGGDCEW